MRKEYELEIDGQEVRATADGPLKAGINHAPHILVTAACGATVRQGCMTLSGESSAYTKEKFVQELDIFVKRIATEAANHERSYQMIEEHLGS